MPRRTRSGAEGEGMTDRERIVDEAGARLVERGERVTAKALAVEGNALDPAAGLTEQGAAAVRKALKARGLWRYPGPDPKPIGAFLALYQATRPRKARSLDAYRDKAGGLLHGPDWYTRKDKSR